MKKNYLLLILCVSLNACKKDALIVDEEKSYFQINAPAPVDPMLGTPIYLTLKPDGTGGFLLNGDIISEAKYKVRGNKIIVDVADLNKTFRFTIVSYTELHGEKGEILKLR